jgi:hypothetical protein
MDSSMSRTSANFQRERFIAWRNFFGLAGFAAQPGDSKVQNGILATILEGR